MATADTRQGNWQWFSDATPDTSMSALAAENAAPTLTTAQSQDGIIRLRISLNEIGGKTDSLGAIDLEYSYDQTNWIQIEDDPPTRTNEHFRFDNGAATNGGTISTRLLTGTTSNGTYHEDDAGTESVPASGELEIDLAIQCHWPPPAETVYFRVTEGGNVIALDTGASVISLNTATAANRGYAVTPYAAEDTGDVHRGFRYSAWEKVWYDGTRWWLFLVQFDDPTNLTYWYWNGPGNDWSAPATVSLPGGSFNFYKGAIDLAFKVISGTPVVWAAYINADASGSTIYFRRGEISGTTITWDSETNVSQTIAQNTVQIAIDDGNYIWVAGSNGTEMFARRSTNADTGTSWTTGWQTAKVTSGSSPITSRDVAALIGLASDKALLWWINAAGTDLEWAYVTDAGGFSSVAQLNSSTDCNNDNTGWTRAGGYVYLVTTDTTASSGGNWHFRVYTESTDTWSDGTTPSTTGPAGSNDGIAVEANGNDIYVFQTGSTGSLGGRTVQYKKYAGPGASGTWDGSFSTISPTSDRGNGDNVVAPRSTGGGTLLVLHHFNHDGNPFSEHTIEYHYLSLGVTISCSAATIASAGQAAAVVPGAVTITCVADTIDTAGQTATISNVTTVDCTAAVIDTAGQTAAIVPGAVTISCVADVIDTAGQAAVISTTTVFSSDPGSMDHWITPYIPLGYTAEPQAGLGTGYMDTWITPYTYLDYALANTADTGVMVFCSAGTIASAGQSGSVIPGAVSITCAVGALAISGQTAAVVAGAVTITCTAGTIDTAGQTASVIPGGVTVTATAAVVDSAGQTAVIVPGGVSVTCTTGALVIAGQTATIENVFVVNCTAGVLTSAGISAAVIPGEATVTAAVGAITATGYAAAVVTGPVSVTCTAAVLSSAGQTATVVPGGVTINSTVGTITITGQAASVIPGAVSVTTTVGAITAAAYAANVSIGAATIDCTAGVISSVGQTAAIIPGAVLVTCTAGVIASGVFAASVISGGVIACAVGILDTAGQAASILPGGVSITAGVGAITTATYTSLIQPGEIVVTCTEGSLTLTGQSSSVVPGGVTITLAVGTIAVGTYSAAIIPGEVVITTTAGTITSTTYGANVSIAGLVITAAVGVINSAGHGAAVLAGPVSVAAGYALLTLDGQTTTISGGYVLIEKDAGYIEDSERDSYVVEEESEVVTDYTFNVGDMLYNDRQAVVTDHTFNVGDILYNDRQDVVYYKDDYSIVYYKDDYSIVKDVN